MELYRVHTKECADPQRQWLEHLVAGGMCPSCYALNQTQYEGGIDIMVESAPRGVAINTVHPPGIGFAREDFLALFGPAVSEHLLLGRVFDRRQRRIPGLVSFVGRHRLLIRGGPTSTRTNCSRCGRRLYFPVGEKYVLKDSLRNSQLYGSWPLGGLVITASLRNRILPGRWKGILISELKVLDQPLDEIAQFPENY